MWVVLCNIFKFGLVEITVNTNLLAPDNTARILIIDYFFWECVYWFILYLESSWFNSHLSKMWYCLFFAYLFSVRICRVDFTLSKCIFLNELYASIDLVEYRGLQNCTTGGVTASADRYATHSLALLLAVSYVSACFLVQ